MGEGDYLTRGVLVTTVVGDAPGVAADPRRVALITSVTNGDAHVSIVATGAPDNQHVILVGGLAPLMLTYKDCGPLVGYAWSVRCLVSLTTVNLIEVLYVGRKGA